MFPSDNIQAFKNDRNVNIFFSQLGAMKETKVRGKIKVVVSESMACRSPASESPGALDKMQIPGLPAALTESESTGQEIWTLSKHPWGYSYVP